VLNRANEPVSQSDEPCVIGRGWRWYFSVVYAVGVLSLAGLVPGWGRWYSQSPAHRQQTDAFFAGRLAVSENPQDLRHDYAWSENGVHQVWGLGVPLWRLPFEALAKAFGQPAFPDRLAFSLALLLAGGLVLRVFLSAGAGSRQAGDPAWGWIVCAWLLVFPPFVTLCCARFDVYEEVLAYCYLFGIALFSGLVSFWRAPSGSKLLLLGFASGLGAMIRPTLFFYGAAAMLLSVGKAWKVGLSRRLIVASLVAYLCGGAALWMTNRARFGSGWEFGHRLNLSDIGGSLYSTRFDYPFRREPLLSAARELAGLMFFTQRFNRADFFETEPLFRWQSATPRFREVYFTTYNSAYALAAVLCCAGAVRTRRALSPVRPDGVQAFPIRLAVAWALPSFAALAVFYLRGPCVSSRYMMDFAPALAVSAAGGLWNLRDLLCHWQAGGFWRAAAQVGSVALLIGELSFRRTNYAPPQALTWPEAQQGLARAIPRTAKLPASHTRSSLTEDRFLPFNGEGWDEDTGETGSSVILFVEDLDCLRLRIATAAGGAPSREQVETLRAKAGLAWLERESVAFTQGSALVTFATAEPERHPRGLEAVFVAMLPTERFLERRSGLRLLHVEWRCRKDRSPAGIGE
jgi:hypothetical protein